MLKIYGFPRSRTSRTLWMVHEIGVPYEFVRTEKGPSGLDSPAFKALNPNGKAPTIEDDGVVIWESLAINLFLAKKHGGALGPADLAEDALMTMWSLWTAAEFEPPAHDVLLHTLNHAPGQRDQTVLALTLSRLETPLGVLNEAIAKGGGHLVGGRFTVADLNVASVAFYLRGAEAPFAAFPAIAAWYEAATRRPAYDAMMALRERG